MQRVHGENPRIQQITYESTKITLGGLKIPRLPPRTPPNRSDQGRAIKREEFSSFHPRGILDTFNILRFS